MGLNCLTPDRVIKGTIRMLSQNIYRQSQVTSFYRSSILTFILFASIIALSVSGIVNAEDNIYSIQLGYFLDNSKAKEKVDSLKGLGHNAFMVESVTEDGGKVTVVYIEKFNTKQDADNEARVLKELNLIREYSIQSMKGAPAPAPKAAQKDIETGYYLQVSSLKDKKNARKKVDEIKKTGRNAFHRYETVKEKGLWYRVYTGSYSSESEALKDAGAMKKSGLITSYYIKPVGEKTVSPKPVTEKDEDEKIFFLHVSSYTEKSNAEIDVNRLKDLGLKAFFVRENISGSLWYRTYIGEFGDEETARKIGSELKDKGELFYFNPIEIDKSKIE